MAERDDESAPLSPDEKILGYVELAHDPERARDSIRRGFQDPVATNAVDDFIRSKTAFLEGPQKSEARSRIQDLVTWTDTPDARSGPYGPSGNARHRVGPDP